MNSQMEQVIAQRKELVERIKGILIESLNLELEPNEITEDCALFGFGLGLDSIDALTLIVGIEDYFNTPIPDNNIHIFRSVNTIADFIISNRSKYAN